MGPKGFNDLVDFSPLSPSLFPSALFSLGWTEVLIYSRCCLFSRSCYTVSLPPTDRRLRRRPDVQLFFRAVFYSFSLLSVAWPQFPPRFLPSHRNGCPQQVRRASPVPERNFVSSFFFFFLFFFYPLLRTCRNPNPSLPFPGISPRFLRLCSLRDLDVVLLRRFPLPR